MPLVALDTMIVDEFLKVFDEECADTMESMESPRRELEPQTEATYWLVALARVWSSCGYTFSDTLYEELAAIPPEKEWKGRRLLGIAFEIREERPALIAVPTPGRRPDPHELEMLGLRRADARHVADAIGAGATHFLTLDQAVLARHHAVLQKWGVRITTPKDFLEEAVRAGAPWPSSEPWPWNTTSGGHDA